MKLVLPDGVRVVVKPSGKLYYFLYEEVFRNKRVVKRTFDLAVRYKAWPQGLKLSLVESGRGIRMEGKITREQRARSARGRCAISSSGASSVR